MDRQELQTIIEAGGVQLDGEAAEKLLDALLSIFMRGEPVFTGVTPQQSVTDDADAFALGFRNA